MKEITPSIFYTGVLNPNMRVFDVIMYTNYGTTYNSFFVKGSEKNALIEGAHRDFLDYYTSNIAEVAGENVTIDYLIINHTEPDHSGCLEEFVKIFPDIIIVASPAAALYLKNITNTPDLKVQVVKDGDSISLGDKTLEFITAPFLHWPDTMFTWIPEEKALFSCDFLGCHFCEPQIFDSKVIHEEEFWDSFQYYYDCIMAPFKPHVLTGLDKIKDLDIDYICTSHGPVLTKSTMDKAMRLYREWSTPVVRERKLIPIFYTTAYQNTQRIAEQAREGVRRIFPDAEIELYNIIEHDMEELHGLLNEADAILLGTLTINRDNVPPMWNLLAGIDAVNFRNRPVALFGSFGWSGEAFANAAARLESVHGKVFEEQYKINFVPNDTELAEARNFGERFAKSLQTS